MKLNLPADSPKPMNVKASTTLTLMPTAGKIVYVYEGLAKDNQHAATYSTDDLFALRQVLINKRAAVKKITGDPADVFVLIKPDKECSYQTLVDLLDEMTINSITRYAIADRDMNDESLLLASK